MNKAVVFVVLLVGGWLMAQQNQDQSEHQPKQPSGQVTEKGCVSRLSGHYVLEQYDPANSYVLAATGNINVGHYLGQQVEVTGTKSDTASTSAHSIRETGGGPPVTIVVASIHAISKRCTH